MTTCKQCNKQIKGYAIPIKGLGDQYYICEDCYAFNHTFYADGTPTNPEYRKYWLTKHATLEQKELELDVNAYDAAGIVDSYYAKDDEMMIMTVEFEDNSHVFIACDKQTIHDLPVGSEVVVRRSGTAAEIVDE